ncbi:testis-expressed protein 47-like isoform X2 [Saccostrea echinata]|uniref:testis-expressed protein 47-like isoform X2 n=1 Tax=Saccostrea echinata TaxID=191078 RepID=UPI002A832CE1|nr:testis-expressed protein 47-like isoform X2 [Saccostrea echinata]XP_061175445.1 testis-expressed protein 47-like isoform X2 [Saccostrea echinata]
MAESPDLTKKDGSEVEVAEEESDGQKSPSGRRKKVKKVSQVKSKKQGEKRFDWPKKSFFEIVCLEGNEMKNLVHRAIFIGKLKEGADRTEVGSYHEQLLKNLQNTNQTEPITGLLLVYMKHIVHVMECSSDAIMAMVRDLKESKSSEKGFLENAKILVISHDIQNRLYQQWSFRQLDIVAARLEAHDSNESTDKIVIDLVTQLLKLGNALAKTPKLNLKNVMDSLHEKLPDLLPQQGVLHYLMEDEDPCMISLEEYIELEEHPYDVVLESAPPHMDIT